MIIKPGLQIQFGRISYTLQGLADEQFSHIGSSDDLAWVLSRAGGNSIVMVESAIRNLVNN